MAKRKRKKPPVAEEPPEKWIKISEISSVKKSLKSALKQPYAKDSEKEKKKQKKNVKNQEFAKKLNELSSK